MSKESPMDVYYRNFDDMMNRNLETIEQRFDDMMDEMKHMLKGVTKQSNRGGRDNRSGRSNSGGRGNRGDTDMVKKTSKEPFSIFCGHCKGSGHHYYDCPDLLQELRRIDEEARLKHASARENDLVETKNEEIVNTREEELKNNEDKSVAGIHVAQECDVEKQNDVVGAELVEVVQESIVAGAISEAKGEVGPTSATTCLSFIVSSFQAHDDHPVEVHPELFDLPTPGPTLPMNVLVPLDIGGKPEHTFIDPFGVYPHSHPYDYVAAPENIICIEHSRHYSALVSLVMYSSSDRRSIDLKPYLRLVFDPGISLVFVIGSACFVLVAAFYDILLIRGRIISNREGMM